MDGSTGLGTWARKLEATADNEPLRASIFVDGAYMHGVLIEDFNDARFPWALIGSLFAPGYRTTSVGYYTAAPHESVSLRGFQAFARVIESVPLFELKLGTLIRKREDGRYEQKQVDVLLAVDMVMAVMQSRVDVVVLVAGDADFLPAVRAVQKMGVSVILWHGDPDYVSAELRAAVDEAHRISKDEIEVT